MGVQNGWPTRPRDEARAFSRTRARARELPRVQVQVTLDCPRPYLQKPASTRVERGYGYSIIAARVASRRFSRCKHCISCDSLAMYSYVYTIYEKKKLCIRFY